MNWLIQLTSSLSWAVLKKVPRVFWRDGKVRWMCDDALCVLLAFNVPARILACGECLHGQKPRSGACSEVVSDRTLCLDLASWLICSGWCRLGKSDERAAIKGIPGCEIEGMTLYTGQWMLVVACRVPIFLVWEKAFERLGVVPGFFLWKTPSNETRSTVCPRYFYLSQTVVTIVTWLILPVVICLSQRLSHACLSINKFVLWNCEWLIKSVIVYLIIPYYLDNRGNSRANTCKKARLLEGLYLLDKKPTRKRFFGDSW